MVKNLLNIFFPELCLGCQSVLTDNEKHLCSGCRHQLPITNFHRERNNPVERIFRGRVKLERGTALLRFEKRGIVQQLLHNLKYRHREEIGLIFGRWMGELLYDEKEFSTVDAVVPVPIHKNKLRRRGYNQVTQFGKEVARKLNAEYLDDVLLKSQPTRTKVFQKRLSRWTQDDGVFTLNHSDKLKNKHVLVVDDIITTGATIEACSLTLNKESGIKISVAAIAIAE
ncbi:MAG: ComF family protein [Flavobacteriaceae bacterium]|nr:ComF family protein [Bacteroidia bacterium]MBT8287711.1 ComF family protein [Bacteroidia bacterium]NNF73932.1 ComF family protein [Flavobacteriaceae bacterium]NNK72355.1 ComF family protein [Flavobacteriaceae bacterium]